MPKQSKSAPLPLPAGGSRAHPPPSSFPPRPCSLRHHTTHTPTHLPTSPDLPLFRRPWLTDGPSCSSRAYRRHGLDLLVSILVQGGRNSTVGSGVVGGQVESGDGAVAKGGWGLAWHRVCYTCPVLSRLSSMSCQSVHRPVGLSVSPSPSWRT